MLKRISTQLVKIIIGFLLLTSLFLLIFRFLPIPSSSFMIQKRISNLIAGESENINYNWVSYDKISHSIKLAVIAAEDQKFFNHFGFDIESINKALDQNKNSKKNKIRGASTITQQTAKNLFLWSGKSFIRKGIEAYFTFFIEVFWSKERILEVYLNIAQFGENDFGVGAASKKYLNKNANRLSYQNAASLASVLPNPIRYKVNFPTKYQLGRIGWIQRQMYQLGEGILNDF